MPGPFPSRWVNRIQRKTHGCTLLSFFLFWYWSSYWCFWHALQGVTWLWGQQTVLTYDIIFSTDITGSKIQHSYLDFSVAFFLALLTPLKHSSATFRNTQIINISPYKWLSLACTWILPISLEFPTVFLPVLTSTNLLNHFQFLKATGLSLTSGLAYTLIFLSGTLFHLLPHSSVFHS